MAKSKYTFAEVESALDKAIKTNPIVAYENKKVKITSGKVLTNNGSFSSFTKGGCTTTDNFISVSEGETLEVLSGGIWGGIESGVVPIVAGWYDADKNFVSVALQNRNYTNGIEITVPSGVSYLAVSYWNGIETKVRKKTIPTVEKDDTKYKNIAVERMKREQQIQHKYIKPYYDYSKLSSGILTFGQDDLVADFADIAQCFIEADVPMFCAYCENANFSFHNVDEAFWGKSSVTVREVINKVVENGGEVMAHHGQQMTQAMLDDFDTCYEHFVGVKNGIESEGWECNGIILAGGIGQVVGSPISDMWVRSNFLYADLYGEEEYAEPYFHRRGALLHSKGKLETLKTEIVTAMNEKKWCVYYLHNFSEFSKDELKELLAWVKEQGYATKTYKEVYDELIAYDIIGNEEEATKDELYGKTVLFLGDSICQGVDAVEDWKELPNYTSIMNTTQTPYSYWIAKNHPNTNVINEGIGGSTLSLIKGETNSISYRIENGYYDKYKGNVDIIVIEGGFNDLGRTSLGYARDNYCVDRINGTELTVKRPNTTTFPALQYIIEYFTRNFEGARVMCMSTYNVADYMLQHQRAMYKGFAEICNHCGVEFIDVFGQVPTANFSQDSVYYTEVHAKTPLHRDYVAPVIERALLYGCDCGVKSRTYFGRNVPIQIVGGYNNKTTFKTGDRFNCKNWSLNKIYCEDMNKWGQVTSDLSSSDNPYYDDSMVNMDKGGSYPLYVSYSTLGETLTCVIPITVNEWRTDDYYDFVSSFITGDENIESDFWSACKENAQEKRDGFVSNKTTYYFSSTGNDSNNGLSSDTPKCDPSTYLSMDNVNLLFKCGDTFNLSNAIELGSNSTISFYGSGEQPVFDFYKNLDVSWTNVSGNVYSASLSGTIVYTGSKDAYDCNIGHLLINNTPNWNRKCVFGSEAETFDYAEWLNTNSDELSWGIDWNTATLYLYSSTNPNDIDIKYANNINAMSVSGKSNSQVVGIGIKGVGRHGINISSSNNITISYCHINNIGGCILNSQSVRFGNGIEIWATASDIDIRNNFVEWCFDTGLTNQGQVSGQSQKRLLFKDNFVRNSFWLLESWGDGYSPNGNFEEIVYDGNILANAIDVTNKTAKCYADKYSRNLDENGNSLSLTDPYKSYRVGDYYFSSMSHINCGCSYSGNTVFKNNVGIGTNRLMVLIPKSSNGEYLADFENNYFATVCNNTTTSDIMFLRSIVNGTKYYYSEFPCGEGNVLDVITNATSWNEVFVDSAKEWLLK